MKVDLVMSTKNGEGSLPQVLKRIDEAFPYENINQKILVDDHSTDKTVFIAKVEKMIKLEGDNGGVMR